MASLGTDSVDVSDIAGQTLRNVRGRYRNIHRDEGVAAAFEFLVLLAVAARSDDPQGKLRSFGIDVPDRPTALSFTKAGHAWMAESQSSLEYGKIARGAYSDVIASWHRKHRTAQERLFEPIDNSFEVWRTASNGAGFCELARLFFASFTERYLKYFLEREASAVTTSIEERDRLGEELEDHVDDISQHAFETARIAQSFAAGWFNNYARENAPYRQAIKRFLWVAFGKMREELLREDPKE
jgi:hypothetical protein